MTNETGDFFSRGHSQLLNIATWMKYLAWVVLVISMLVPFARYIEINNAYMSQQAISGAFAPASVVERMKEHPAFAISVIVDVFYSWLVGFGFFLVIRGVSLGLNMIVETDINYRELRRGAVQHEQ